MMQLTIDVKITDKRLTDLPEETRREMVHFLLQTLVKPSGIMTIADLPKKNAEVAA
jgi:hypothetical protein